MLLVVNCPMCKISRNQKLQSYPLKMVILLYVNQHPHFQSTLADLILEMKVMSFYNLFTDLYSPTRLVIFNRSDVIICQVCHKELIPNSYTGFHTPDNLYVYDHRPQSSLLDACVLEDDGTLLVIQSRRPLQYGSSTQGCTRF